MDILIKGLELPTEERISLSIYPNGIVVNHSTLKVEKNRTTAIELPPHGRLVSADEVQKKMSYYGFRAIDMTIHEFVEDELTTVLEAST